MSSAKDFLDHRLNRLGAYIEQNPLLSIALLSLWLVLFSSAFIVFKYSGGQQREIVFSEMDDAGKFVAPLGILSEDAVFAPLQEGPLPEIKLLSRGVAQMVAPERILDPTWIPESFKSAE